jgi:Spy/CpxP family protein refolding chaperone
MKSPGKTLTTILAATALALPFQLARAENTQDQIEVARSVLKADRQAVVAENLQLTEAESTAFWPLYHQYRAEMDKIGNDLLKLVKEYAASHPNVPEDKAKKLLKNLGDLEKKQVTTRAAWLKKMSKVLPATKALRFAQIESRLDLAVRLQVAASIPLVETPK